MEASGQHHAPAVLLPGKNPGTHWIEDWVGPSGDLDRCVVVFCHLPWIDPRFFHRPFRSQGTSLTVPKHITGFILI